MIRDQLHYLLMADYLPFCLLCEDVFLKDLASGEGRYCSPALVNSLLALASRTWNEHQRPHPNQRQQERPNYHDVADVGSPPSGWWYSQALFDEAEALIRGNGPPDTLPDVQTLGILALYHVSCGRDAEAYELAGSFAAAITELCLREPLAEDEQDEQYAQVRATTYCGAQSLVRMLGLLRAHCPGIHATILQDDRVTLDQPPCPYRANNPPVLSSTSCQWRKGAHASQLGGLQLIPAKLFQLTEWVYKLLASAQTATSDEVVLVYHRCLKWYESVLAVLKTDRSNSPFVLFIHMYYQFCLLSLFRRYGGLPLEGLSGNPHEICFQAAQSILGLSKSYVGAITLRQVPPLVPYYVCASGLLSFAIEEAGRGMLRVVPLLHFDHGDGAVVETAEPLEEAIRKEPDDGLVGSGIARDGRTVEVDEDDVDSSYGDEISSASTSLRSSIFRYEWKHGRRYHSYQAGSYSFPNDDQEQDRLDMIHHVYCRALDDRLFLAPIDPTGLHILDIGTGTGIWPIDLADQFPSASIVGNDLSPIQPAFVPPNVTFVVDDVELDWVEPRIMPVGSWPKDPRLKEIGAFLSVNISEGVEGFTASLFRDVLAWSQEELEVHNARVRSALRAKGVHAIFDFLVVTGMKPRTPSEPIVPPDHVSTPIDVPSDGPSPETISRERKVPKASQCLFPIEWDKIRYDRKPVPSIRYRQPHKRAINSRSQPSAIYRHGAQLTTDGDNKFWLCKYCHVSGHYDTALFASESTTSIIYHLKHQHKLEDFGYNAVGSDPFSIAKGILSPASYLGARRLAFNGLQFKGDFTDWVVDLDLTFRQATHRRTYDIFTLYLEDSDKVLPRSPSALSSWIREKWLGDTGRRVWLREQLHLTRSKIHLSMDAWTSEEGTNYLAIVAHFLDERHKLQTALLDLPSLKGPHSGENLAKVLSTVLDFYDIAPIIGYFMMDNATSNDTCIQELAKRYSTISHQSVSKLEKRLRGASDEERFEIWRKHSFVGKLHNFCVWINRSDQRREQLKRYVLQSYSEGSIEHLYTRVLVDGGIRWNSAYAMIERALKLRHPIDLFFLNYRYGGDGYDVSQDALTPQDWVDLGHFIDILKPFKDLTKRMEGRANKAGIEGSHGSLHETIESLDVLFKKLQEAGNFAEDHPDVVSTYYSHAIDAARLKLEEYFVALHPANKFTYFELEWSHSKQWVSEAKKVVQDAYAKYEEGAAEKDLTEGSLQCQQEEEQEDNVLGNPVTLDPLQEARRRRQRLAAATTSGIRGRKRTRLTSELDEFMARTNKADLDVEDPLEWWVRHAADYPILSKMAFDHFSCPAMSAECERVFSQAKKTITDERNRLSSDTVAAIECQKHLLRSEPFVAPPWWERPQTYIEETAAEARKKHLALLRKEPAALHIYTDGSGINAQIGAAAVCPTIQQTRSSYMGADDTSTVYAGELQGISLALDIALQDRTEGYHRSNVLIYTDNQAAI
ncbi:cyclase/dehydrase family protein [Purpureocillium lavendulum]|uniref:Cyclase/dehydrase family protein n=1 Tax=Purpureocillium lavendulum TaxID=1247861 RepID=A0AB34FH36_9HYPO|nr:cyclase/dehydrase family protein [Purpureocillium lavendulum]